MPLADMVAALRTDLADPGSERFGDTVLQRCILKSVFPVGRDAGVSLTIVSGEISPEPTGEVLELLLLQAQIAACQFMRAATANAFSFSSGDKKVDKTSQPEHWAKLEVDLTTAYKARVKALSPGSTAAGDDSILTPPALVPVIYEQGVELVDEDVDVTLREI
jgi:hypothetical protein